MTADLADLEALAALAARIEDTPTDPRAVWRMTARPEQLLPPLDGPPPWRVIYWQGGRGSGKTRTCAGAMTDLLLADTDGEGEYGIIAPTYADAWTKCVEGESGLLRAMGTSMAEIKDHRSRLVSGAWRTYGQVVLKSGLVVYVDSAAEGGLRVQGRNLKAIWCSEVGLWEKWETAWKESVKYAVRSGVSKILAEGTPKMSRPARALVRALIKDDPGEGGVIVRRLRTVDNRDNLSPEFYRSVIGSAKGTRLERQELEGELLDDVPNALWTRDLLDECQCPAVGQDGGPALLFGAVIGVDPSDGAEDSDEQAYTVAGKGAPDDHHLYVAENWGGQEAPVPFARRVIGKAVQYDAMIVVEKNHGGAWLRSTFWLVLKEMTREGLIPGGRAPQVRMIHASQAKRTRAEPVSAMYYRRSGDGRPQVLHCKAVTRDREGHIDVTSMVDLEDQMCSFTGAEGERSPDRLDSLVWALDPFKQATFGPPGQAGRQAWAADGGDLLDAAGGTLELPEAGDADSRARRKLAQAHGGAYDRAEGDWGLDGFAPADDERERQPSGSRGNVHAWR